jgi:hypothetical protein
MTANSKISNLISTQMPFYVRNDHENFVRFVEAYYEYMEQSNTVTGIGKTLDVAKSLPQNMNVDESVDIFTQKFYDNYLKFIPGNVITDKNLLIKHIQDFYKARGTEKSIEFLLRIMFGEEETQFYYPKRDILRASDGKWFIEKSLKVSDVFIDGTANNDILAVQNFSKRQIKGNTSLATAVVERVDVYYEGGTLVKELKISQQTKTFSDSEILFATFTKEDGSTHSITANLFSGLINTVVLTRPGIGYSIGDVVQIESNSGTGGSIIVSSVTSGNISGISVLNGGAGFQVNNSILISGGGGSNARANVLTVDTSGKIHPNTYNISYTTIASLSNVAINVADYFTFTSNVTSGSNANTTVANTILSFTFANTGPIQTVLILNAGENYTSTPNVSAVANTRVFDLGILGRMRIVDGGLNYQVDDQIEFINVLGGYGSGARANVYNVAANGKITEVKFINSTIAGYPIGGMGYSQTKLPTANVISGTGNGAIVTVTAILGDGENFLAGTSSIGAIRGLTILNRGSGYKTTPTLNLTSIGDGTAQAVATIITGTFTYPGRYLNDDGHLSGYNFLEDRDYYQDFSYVVKAKQSIEKYRKALKDLIHPAGMKLFGEYLFVDNGASLNVSVTRAAEEYNTTITYAGTYKIVSNATTAFINVSIQEASTLNIANLSNVFIEFLSGDTGNLVNTVYSVTPINDTMFQVDLTRANIASITIANTGTGYSNSNIRFAGGSGRGANASYTVNTSNGGIENITIISNGSLYITGEKVYALGVGGQDANLVVSLQYSGKNDFLRPVNDIIILQGGSGYNSNGFLVFSGGGTGSGVNAAYTIANSQNTLQSYSTNPSWNTISTITINNFGTNYNVAPTATANGSNISPALFEVVVVPSGKLLFSSI